jgi:hypothetical protein
VINPHLLVILTGTWLINYAKRNPKSHILKILKDLFISIISVVGLFEVLAQPLVPSRPKHTPASRPNPINQPPSPVIRCAISLA